VVKTFSRRTCCGSPLLGPWRPRFTAAAGPTGRPRYAAAIARGHAGRNALGGVPGAGEDRRKNVYDALMAIDPELAPALKRKKHVLISPTSPAISSNWRPRTPIRCAASWTTWRRGSRAGDRSRGVLRQYHGWLRQFQVPATDRGVSFAESGTDRSQSEGKYITAPLIDTNLQMFPVRLAARLMDPDAFIVSASIPKTHDCVVATMGVKNLVMGAPLHSPVNGRTGGTTK